jgi:hypothetical protein
VKTIAGIVIAMVALAAFLAGCYNTRLPPPKCANIMRCPEDPTAYPPLHADRREPRRP